MQRSNNSWFSLKYSMETVLLPDAESDEVLEYKVELIPHSEPGEPDPCVGHFSVWRFNIEAYKEHSGYPLFDLFDANSEEAAQLYRALFDPVSEEFRAELGEHLFQPDLLYFQLSKFDEHLKRSPIILALAERIIQTLGNGCAVASLWLGDEPYPDENRYGLDEILRFWESQKENEVYWGKIGFRRLPETLFLVRDLALRSNPIQDILGEELL